MTLVLDNVFSLEIEKGQSHAVIHLGGTQMILKGYFEVCKSRWSTKMYEFYHQIIFTTDISDSCSFHTWPHLISHSQIKEGFHFLFIFLEFLSVCVTLPIRFFFHVNKLLTSLRTNISQSVSPVLHDCKLI